MMYSDASEPVSSSSSSSSYELSLSLFDKNRRKERKIYREQNSEKVDSESKMKHRRNGRAKNMEKREKKEK